MSCDIIILINSIVETWLSDHLPNGSNNTRLISFQYDMHS